MKTRVLSEIYLPCILTCNREMWELLQVSNKTDFPIAITMRVQRTTSVIVEWAFCFVGLVIILLSQMFKSALLRNTMQYLPSEHERYIFYRSTSDISTKEFHHY